MQNRLVVNGFLKENLILTVPLINKCKARLVAKDFTQKQNVDYFDTFAPITNISFICVLIALASIYKLVHQMDVKITFLIGDLE